MNGQEQKARHGQILQLRAEMEQALIDVNAAILETNTNLEAVRGDMGTLLAGQDALNQKRLDALASAHDERLKANATAAKAAQEDILGLEDYVFQFVRTGFFARLGWVLFGRVPR